MGLRVNTNVFSLNAQRNLSNTTSRLSGNYSRLSSGLRIASAADDAAGLGISERMRSNIRSLGQASRNALDGQSLVNTSEGALNEVNSNLVRMRELAIQSSNEVLSSSDRSVIAAEFNELVSEIDRISSVTDFNGISLLDGTTATLDLQVGVGTSTGDTITLSLVDASLSGLSISSLDVSTDASGAISAIDTAIDSVNVARGTLGASSNRLSSTIRSIANYQENLSGAESRIRDVDVAFETADLTRNSILQQAAVSVLAQANSQPSLALSLLG